MLRFFVIALLIIPNIAIFFLSAFRALPLKEKIITFISVYIPLITYLCVHSLNMFFSFFEVSKGLGNAFVDFPIVYFGGISVVIASLFSAPVLRHPKLRTLVLVAIGVTTFFVVPYSGK